MQTDHTEDCTSCTGAHDCIHPMNKSKVLAMYFGLFPLSLRAKTSWQMYEYV